MCILYSAYVANLFTLVVMYEDNLQKQDVFASILAKLPFLTISLTQQYWLALNRHILLLCLNYVSEVS